MSYEKAVSPEEQKWQRQSDARTLARAEEIKADKDRLAAAHVGAQELLQEAAQDLRGLAKVSSNKTVDSAIRAADKAKSGKKPPAPIPTFPTSGDRLSRDYNPARIGKLF